MKPTVSCIVSAYRATSEDILGRLENLFSQTYRDIEVILIQNDTSDDIEHVVDLVSAKEIDRFRVLMTRREGIYSSWNRGIRVSHGKYIMNANVDDRLFPNGIELLVRGIEESKAGLVYGDSVVVGHTPPALLTEDNVREVQSFRAPYTTGTLGLTDFNPEHILLGHCTGNNPLWRRDLHDKHGWFDESMQLAGDYEWTLRLQSRGVSFYYIKDRVGTFYFGRNATTLHQSQSDYEATLARLRWKKELNGRARPDHAGGV